MSGILGQILGGLMGGGGQSTAQQAGQSAPIVTILQQLLATNADGSGGIGGLVSRMQSAGLGQQVQSWIGGGANQPISPENVGQAFPADQIGKWATQAGTTPEAIRQVLADALPHVVDRVTPEGQVPTQSPDISSLLQGLLGSMTAARRP